MSSGSLLIIYQESSMFSTSTELSSGHFRRSDRSASPPTVEQIAMGLHLSRTPHLRQTRPHHSLYARSSLKNGGTHDPGLSTASSSTVTSTVPSTPHSIHSNKSLRAKMARFLPLPRSFSAPQSLAPSPNSSSTDFATPKKAVRFSPEPLARPAEEH
ncbi:hypothetical protein CYLTODRAFT_85286 [Cylindrobasidium torrendii FP15055 ss-10]|uniref:Uncharacterized protein n=1 Tax=Cylindrobasidium torrendii FP15055 ss-10 TaxID=1314674 RepID=A0A0D7BNT3_9AGAR|nr:hypothetical protein CYLTODRAFT_85286 [Cylindrobasidium torrendii FP15055 ss-10]